MSEYIIVTDSACDIKPEILKEWGVPFASLTFRFDGNEKEYLNYDMTSSDFYQKMREGGVAKTAAVNVGAFELMFEEYLTQGKDVLYLGFSSGLSTTYNSGRLAAEQLKEKYPERKIIAVDTLSASAGFGLLLYLTLKKKNEGATIEEAAEFATKARFNLCHWFTVDDLMYLKRGGRISPTVAFVGNVLGIKPVLHMDNEGHLINVSKVRGRRTAVQALAQKYDELAVDTKSGTLFISHGDCLADAEYLASIIKEKHNVDVEIITDVGPVIGAHTGPGVLAFFFVGNER
ncbi:MAG: DegV family protein [Clostridia bacterium]|nr:DegV family protein [Clostridia bacterium]